MSSFPMSIYKVEYKHKGGTKAYFLTLVTNAANESILIKRWGKVGATGQLKVEQFGTAGPGNAAFSKAQKERESRGYILQKDDTKIVPDLPGLQLAIGRTIYPMVGAHNINHLDPTIDTTGMREPEATQDENGKYTGRQTRTDPDFIKAQQEEVRRREEEARAAAEAAALKEKQEIAANYKANPLYGRF